MNGEKRNRAALLWDESFLWGVMAHKALVEGGLAHDLIRAEDIKKGRLIDYSLLFVPGGWASNKIQALGDEGVEAIRRFVRGGGTYIGFCGGAGLATEDGIGLLPVKRRPTSERVPSFNGRIRVNTSDHPLWQGVAEPVFHAWWPSQFVVDRSVSVLATYGEAMPDSFSSDVNVGDAVAGGWAALERIYGINLDPKRLMHEPAVIEGEFGEGRVLLSLLHFDTPGDRNGAMVLKNLWMRLSPEVRDHMPNSNGFQSIRQTDGIMGECEKAVTRLIDLGQRNFLWFWRNPLLLQWRRGVRGLEYCTLFIMVKELAQTLRVPDGKNEFPDMNRARGLIMLFTAEAGELLLRERLAMQNSHITYERCDDPAIQLLRGKLFSRSKSHGGLFKEVVDELDKLLYFALTRIAGAHERTE